MSLRAGQVDLIWPAIGSAVLCVSSLLARDRDRGWTVFAAWANQQNTLLQVLDGELRAQATRQGIQDILSDGFVSLRRTHRFARTDLCCGNAKQDREIQLMLMLGEPGRSVDYGRTLWNLAGRPPLSRRPLLITQIDIPPVTLPSDIDRALMADTPSRAKLIDARNLLHAVVGARLALRLGSMLADAGTGAVITLSQQLGPAGSLRGDKHAIGGLQPLDLPSWNMMFSHDLQISAAGVQRNA